MRTSTRQLQTLCRTIIENYAYFVRDKVALNNRAYFDTGIIENLYAYKDLFMRLLSVSLGLKDHHHYNRDMSELINLISMELNKHSTFVSVNRVLIYRTCGLIFDKIVSGILSEQLV